MENKYYTPSIEIWKEVIDYEDEYEVSNLGNVRRKVKNLKSSLNAWGYPVVGLSKMNRIVDYYAKRPQVQERLTMQIVQELQKVLGTDDVACVIDAKHLCVNSRGIRDIESSTVTAEFGGKFKEDKVRREFLDYIKLDTQF